MSVLRCDRNGCQNILCDRYSSKYGYICSECFHELLMRGPLTDVSKFMELEKADENEALGRFDAVFKEI